VAPRAYWKGYLRLSLVSCPIQLFPAISERKKLRFHQINRRTGNRIKYCKLDAVTGGQVDAKDIVMANQLKFPLSSIINYLAQMVSQLFGFPPIVQPGTRVASLDDYLFSASAYYLLIKENPDYVSQIPGAVSRLDDVASAGAQLKAVLDGIGSKDLFLNASQGLVARYQQARDALKAAIAGYKDNTFIPANTCGSSSFDGCIPPGVSLWEDASKTTSYQPSVPPINRCDGGPALNLTVPANNIYYAVPPALLLADQRTGDHPIGLCFEAHFTDTDQGPNIKGVSMTIRVTYRGLLMLSMTAQAGHNGVPWLVCPTTCGGPVDVYWYFLPSSGQVAQGWDVSVKKGQFEDHTQITVSTQPWAQQLCTRSAAPPPTGNGGHLVKALGDHGSDGEKRTSAAFLRGQEQARAWISIQRGRRAQEAWKRRRGEQALSVYRRGRQRMPVLPPIQD